MVECQYFGSCGGCSSQHIMYSTQIEGKKKSLIDAIGYDDIAVITGEPYGYRNRMDFIFHAKGVGLREKGKWHSIIDIEQCPIANLRVNQLLKEVRDFFNSCDYFHVKRHTGTFRYAVIRAPRGSSSISIVLNADSSRLAEAIEKVRVFSSITSADSVIITRVHAKSDVSIGDEYFVVKGTDYLSETFLDKKFTFPVQGFFQNNSMMAEKMQQHVKRLMEKYPTHSAHLLDLYGGVGTFGIVNATVFQTVTIIESVQLSIDFANTNIKYNDVSNVTGAVLDAKQLSKVHLQSPLYIITDPPRSGMHSKTIQQLRTLDPEVIVYISCNIKVLAKELPQFENYRIQSVALFDFFPQTPHMEVAVELVRQR